MTMIYRTILAIFRRELQSYLASPLSYLVAGFFWLLGGVFLVTMLLGSEGIIAQVAQADQVAPMGMPPLDVAYEFIKAYVGLLGSLSLFILPILSMGLYAEERKRGTLELLATSPLPNWAVALGKLLAVVSFYIGLVLPLMVGQAIALATASPPSSQGYLVWPTWDCC
ncbi:MAG: ABC transporter permease [Nodosilinea sp. LVE1205-7]|jgi:ABC-2 type transport system permease protein